MSCTQCKKKVIVHLWCTSNEDLGVAKRLGSALAFGAHGHRLNSRRDVLNRVVRIPLILCCKKLILMFDFIYIYNHVELNGNVFNHAEKNMFNNSCN